LSRKFSRSFNGEFKLSLQKNMPENNHFSFLSKALKVPCYCEQGCSKPMFHNLPLMLKELRKTYPSKLSSHGDGFIEEKEFEDKDDENYQSANDLLIPDTPSSEQQQQKQAKGDNSFSVSQVETEKARPALPKPGLESDELFGSESSTEDQKNNVESLSAGSFDAKPTSEVMITTKPAVNLYGSSSSKVPKSDVSRRSSRKQTATQIANEKRKLWEIYIKEGRIDG